MRKTILILGGDGYVGWPLAMKIAVRYPNEKIIIADNEWRRNALKSFGFQTLIPIAKPLERIEAFSKVHGRDNLHYIKMDVNSEKLEQLIEAEMPHTIYHLAQQCSAPYSMKGVNEALFTINNNESGNMRLLWAIRKHIPDAHLIKLGSFGEYAQGGIDIAEGYFLPTHNGTVATKLMPFPREADDIYHISKINDSNYVSMASRIWKLRITDVMQSTIFGFLTEEMDGCEALYTRCDYDPIFGTVVNRFLTQTVIGHPLTVYGKGNQRTGLMALKDSVNSLTSMLYNPPAQGVHKVINNTTETNFSINELSETIKSIAGDEGYDVKIVKTHDPRVEQSDNKLEYSIDTNYSGHGTFHTPISEITKGMLRVIERFKENIVTNLFIPNVKWYAEISSMIKPPSSLGNEIVANEAYWELFREYYFHSERINLNPGTLGSTSSPVREKRNHQHLIKDPEGYPLGSYESGRKSIEVISDLCGELWPSPGYNLAVTHSTSQTMNLLALAMLRKFHQESAGPYKIFTTTHEHEGGIGCFQYLPEFEVFYIEDSILADPSEMKRMLLEIQPHIAFFSHLQYDTGNIAPVEEWCNAIRVNVRGCKIILDVAQSLGLYEFPFGNADVVLGSTHKWLFGPHGGGLMWMTPEFQKWIGAIYWSGHGLAHDPKVTNISIPGGQDFRLYPAIEEALQLYKQTGTAVALNRSLYLGAYFQKRLDELFSNCGISFTFLNNYSAAVISIAFTDYDPYPLYKFLNEQTVHTKCIKNHKIAGVEYHIIRIGIPYYETIERLNFALFEIGRYLSENKPVVSEEALVTY